MMNIYQQNENEPKHTRSFVKYSGGNAVAWTCSLIFFDNVIHESSGIINSKSYRNIIAVKLKNSYKL